MGWDGMGWDGWMEGWVGWMDGMDGLDGWIPSSMVEDVDLLNEGFLPEKKGRFCFF